MRARLLALATGLLVVGGFPLARILAATADPAAGDLDLSDAWAWLPVVLAGLASSAAVFFWCLHRDTAGSLREVATHGDFEYHDAMLQRMVVARMALDLDEPDRAGQVLDTVIESASDVVTSFVDPRDPALPLRDRAGSGVDRRIRNRRASSCSVREQGVGTPLGTTSRGVRE